MFNSFDTQYDYPRNVDKPEEEKSLDEDSINLLKDGALEVFNSLLNKSRQKNDNKDNNNKEIDPKWQRIRSRFLNQDEATPAKDKAKTSQSESESNAQPANIHIMDLTQALYKIKLDLDKADEKKSTIDTKEMKRLKDALGTATHELSQMKFRYKKDLENLSSYAATIERQEALLKEKNNKIEELQRLDNVALWEKEKTRLYETELKRVKVLETERDDLRKANENLQDKIKVLEETVRIDKLKMSHCFSSGNDKKEKSHTANQIYALEKDLSAFERELIQQSKYICGILGGIRIDIWKTFHEHIDTDIYPAPGTRKSSYTPQSNLSIPSGLFSGQNGLTPQFNNSKNDSVKQNGTNEESHLNNDQLILLSLLWKRMYLVYQAAHEGKLGQVRADLPDYYISVDKNIQRIPIKKLSASYYKEKPIQPADQTIQNSGLAKQTLAPIPSAPTQTNTEVKHPELINPRTGRVDMIVVLKHFPHMTKEYVEEQWDAFKKFDTNGDRTLDLPEMMRAMNSTVGAKFTATQVGEVMNEVDMDHSQSIDFYEYITVAGMLKQKSGKSEVFRSTLIQQNASSVSKICVIQ